MIQDAQRSIPSLRKIAAFPFTVLVFIFYELPLQFVLSVVNGFYRVLELLIVAVFKPPPPVPQKRIKYRGRIAIVGAGLTGVSSAAHAVAHGFDVVLFEKNDCIGGIWSSVNATSGLQLNSMLYRFHPAVKWKRAFPLRDEILGEIRRVHHEYNLEPKTRYNTPVTSVRRATDTGSPSDDHPHAGSKWVVNDGSEGVFDAIIVTVGTCGEPNMVTIKGMPGWKEEDQKKHDSGDSTNQTKENTSRREPRHDKRKGRAPLDAHLFDHPGTADRPTQDDGYLAPDGQSAWQKPRENAWDVAGDQIAKQEQGFPKPSEAFEPAEDIQKPVAEVLEEGVHEKVRGEAPVEHHEQTHREPTEDSKTDEKNESGHDFQGPILHSSWLDHEDAPSYKGKTVAVIGSGASAVEAVETALSQGAHKCIVLARDDKWIIPRNIVVDTLISAQPFGREMPLSFLWERFITWFNYRGVEDLVPAHSGLFEGTPVVNDEFLKHVKTGKCEYVRGDVDRLARHGVHVNVRGRESKPGDEGTKKYFNADIVVLATGFKKPQIDFLPEDLFPESYERPNLYLQNFSTEDWSVLMTNSSYMNAIGTVGHFHIGIYTRILLTFLMDKESRPTPKDMKLWVDVLRFIKRGAKGGALGFFTYMELTIWLVLFHLFRLDRLRWLFFIMQGWGVPPEYED